MLRVSTRKVVISPVGLDQARLQPERRYGRQHVAAIGSGIHPRFLDGDLREKKFEVHAGLLPAAHDADLAGQRIGAAEPVDLARVGRAHHREQDGVALRDFRRQITLEEETDPAKCRRA